MAMAAGEYVSVCSQADTERADVALERKGFSADKDYEMEELAGIYVGRGIDPSLAKEVARQLMARDAISAHARDELGISANLTARPVQAAFTSATTFAVGAAMPLFTAVVVPATGLVPFVAGVSLLFLAVLVGLGCTRRRRKHAKRRATRNVLGCTGNGRDSRRRSSFRRGRVSGFELFSDPSDLLALLLSRRLQQDPSCI